MVKREKYSIVLNIKMSEFGSFWVIKMLNKYLKLVMYCTINKEMRGGKERKHFGLVLESVRVIVSLSGYNEFAGL